MDIEQPTPLLGGLSPRQFMRRHWQKKPLLIRQAVPHGAAPLTRAQLFALAGQEAVQSRLVVRQGADGWQLRCGPFGRRALPPLTRPDWTLLVQGVDQHCDAARALLERFRFVPDARLDDLMISYASGGGGVGPHVDSYDVFLLQAQGRRRWRYGRQRELTLREGLPLKILADFQPEHEALLEPGDILYLPPNWAHDGVAEGDCMTCSIGFRRPTSGELARELLERLADDAADLVGTQPYRDPRQPAVTAPAHIPQALFDFARAALAKALDDPEHLALLLGEHLSDVPPTLVFEARESCAGGATGGVALDRRTRMLYDERHVFINGEGFVASGRDALLLHALADRRALDAAQVGRLGREARNLIEGWIDAGWLHEQ